MFPDLMRDDVFRLESRRLWLRWPRASDADAVTQLAGDAEVAEMTANVPHPYPAGAAADFVLRARAANLSGGALTLVLALRRKPSETIGCISLKGLDRGTAELGYWLGRQYWGHGLMSEAVHTLLGVAFQVTDLTSVTATVRSGNRRSAGVLEACGFRATGPGMVAAPARGGSMLSERYRLRRNDFSGAGGSRERPLATMQMQTA